MAENAPSTLPVGPAKAFSLDDLCSRAYRKQLFQMVAQHAWAGGGVQYAAEAARLVQKSGSTSLLDYGCGEVDMAAVFAEMPGMHEVKVRSYDPGVPGRQKLPEPADVVMCVDCLEHVEPDRVHNVISHIHSLTRKCALLVIATRPADKRLPDNRNAHLTIDNAGWWITQLLALGGWKGRIVAETVDGVHMWWRKLDTTNDGTLW